MREVPEGTVLQRAKLPVSGVHPPLQVVEFFFSDFIREGLNKGSHARTSQVKCKWLLGCLEGIGELAKVLPKLISLFPRLSALFLLSPPLVPFTTGRGIQIACKGQYWA